MSEIQISRFVAASPEEVFDHLHKPELMSRWLGGFARAEQVSNGPVGVGSTSTDVFEEKGRTIEMHTEITQFEPPRAMAASIDGPGVAMASSYELEPVDGGTRLTQTSVSMWKMPYRLLGPAMTAATRRRIAADLDRLVAIFTVDG